MHSTSLSPFRNVAVWLYITINYIVYSTVYCVHVACNCAMIEDHTHCIACSLRTLTEVHSSIYSV